jgi:hypothetical protein
MKNDACARCGKQIDLGGLPSPSSPEQLWCSVECFNAYCKAKGIDPVPWVDISDTQPGKKYDGLLDELKESE